MSANNHFPGKGNLSPERGHSSSPLDCSIVNVVGRMPTDHGRGVSAFQSSMAFPWSSLWERAEGSHSHSQLTVSLPLNLTFGETSLHKMYEDTTSPIQRVKDREEKVYSPECILRKPQMLVNQVLQQEETVPKI